MNYFPATKKQTNSFQDDTETNEKSDSVQNENIDDEDVPSADEDVPSILNDFKSTMTAFTDATESRLLDNKDYKKFVKAFTKSMKTIIKSKKGNFERSLFAFNKEQLGPKQRKKKRGSLIPIQSTAKGRRKFKHKGLVV